MQSTFGVIIGSHAGPTVERRLRSLDPELVEKEPGRYQATVSDGARADQLRRRLHNLAPGEISIAERN